MQVAAAFHVCDQLREALQILKRCETEEMRTAYYTVLTATSPKKGFRLTVSKMLKVDKSKNPWRYCKEQRAWISEWLAGLTIPLKVGDRVTSKRRQQEGTVVDVDATGAVRVQLDSNGKPIPCTYPPSEKKEGCSMAMPIIQASC